MKQEYKLFDVTAKDLAPDDPAPKRRRSASAPVVKVNKKIAKKRYELHRALKGKAIIDGAKRTIDVPYTSFEEIPVGDRYYIGQLIKLGYNVQLKII